MNILIAENDINLLNKINSFLTDKGFNIIAVQDGYEVRDIFYNNQIDLVIFDWVLYLQNGKEVIEELRVISDVKILIITSKTDVINEVKAFNIGADDYIKKPFDMRVLYARIKKILQLEDIVSIEDIRFYLTKNIVCKQGVQIKLTSLELKLLKYLIINKNKILSKEMILNNVWGLNYFGSDRTVDTHIRRLREKLGDSLIITYRGIGYSINK